MAPKNSSKKQPPKGQAVSSDPYKDLPKNEKGKYTSWRSGTPAADTLKVLVRGGLLDGMTAGQVQKHNMYKVFDLWENNCFASALTNMRKQYKKEIETARGAGSSAVRTHTTLGAIDEEQTYNSAEDSDFEDLSDAVSAMSIGDHTYDTRTVGFRSAAVPGLGRTRSATKQSEEPTSGSSKRLFIHGNKFIELPYMVDQWRDSAGDARVSVQFQLVAGGEQWKKIIIRVSTHQKELVVYIPISEFLLRADWAFEHFFLSSSQLGPLSEGEKEAYKLVMSVHTKTAGRKIAVSKVLERTVVEGNYYIMRVPLPRKVQHDFATKENDKFFWGKKTVTYPDGSSFMFVELIGAKVDGYRAAEDVSIAANHVAAYPFQSAAPVFAAAATQDEHMDVAPPPVPRVQPPVPSPAQPPVPSPAQPPVPPPAQPPAVSEAMVLHDAYTNNDLQGRAAKQKPSTFTQAREAGDQEQLSPAHPPPIRNLMVPSPPPNQRRSTLDDDWTLETVQTSVTGPHPPLPQQEEEQQETIVVSSLQFAANNPTY